MLFYQATGCELYTSCNKPPITFPLNANRGLFGTCHLIHYRRNASIFVNIHSLLFAFCRPTGSAAFANLLCDLYAACIDDQQEISFSRLSTRLALRRPQVGCFKMIVSFRWLNYI